MDYRKHGKRNSNRQQQQQTKDDSDNRPRLNTRPLTVSTRGIGFTISRIISTLQQRFPDRNEEIPVAAIYRTSLAQLHAKLHCANRGPFVNFHTLKYQQAYKVKNVSRGSVESIQCYRTNFSQVALIIDSVGKVELGHKKFAPVLFKDDLNPLNIRFDNLRNYCEQMANPETELSIRINGFELNSIPNAKWGLDDENNPESIVLKNPTEIIPANYYDYNDQCAMFKDLSVTREFFDEYKWYTPIAKINYNGNGDPGFLVSTHVVLGKTLKLNNNDISGDQTDFWAAESISQKSWCVGVAGLVGEVLDPMDGGPRTNIEGPRTVLNWRGISNLIF